MAINVYKTCNDKASIVTVGGNEFFFSYETCIAFRGMIDGTYRKIRRANDWGPTTGKHFNQLGAKEFDMLPTVEFVDTIERVTAG